MSPVIRFILSDAFIHPQIPPSRYTPCVTAVNGGRLFALSYMNLTNSASAFEQIHISSFMATTLVSIRIPQIGHYEVISLDSSNDWSYTRNFMQDISVPLDVSESVCVCVCVCVCV